MIDYNQENEKNKTKKVHYPEQSFKLLELYLTQNTSRCPHEVQQ